jgi:putative tryptophan/tyrosine transport system substrate-binding protein
MEALLLAALLLACALCLVGRASCASLRPKIAIVLSGNAEPYQQALEGFRQALSGKIEVEISTHSLEENSPEEGQVIQQIRTGAPNMVFCIGSSATTTVSKHIGDLPLLALSGTEVKKSNLMGVLLDVPMESQLQWIHQVMPNCRSVGIVYTPSKNQHAVDDAVKQAQGMGLTVQTQKVEVASDLPLALDRLSNRVEALLGIPNDIVYSSKTAKHILVFSFQNRIPLIGVSQAWVKAGSLYSLDLDYTDLGAQCGDLAQKILQGAKPGSLPSFQPRKILFLLNLKTAQHMKIEIPESLLKMAHQVYH